MQWWLYTIVIIYLINLTSGDQLSSQPKIVIIGAGPSGIAAASKLYENGFENVTILEAENRIGGRIRTTWFGDRWIDLGAQWVHGQNNNIAYELASPYGLLEVPPEDFVPYFTTYNSNGVQIPELITQYFIQLYLDIHEGSSNPSGGKNGSAGEYFTTVMSNIAKKFTEDNETLINQFIHLFEDLQNSEDASDTWFDTSIRGYEEYWECPGNNQVNWKDRGYGMILDILMKKYPNPEEVLPVVNNTITNTEVVNINYNTTEGGVLIESSDGKKYIADHVIVTPSLGVLKEQYETLFTPALPESKVKTIKGLAMGSVAKIFLSFDEAWWPNDFVGITFVWSESDREEYKNDPDKKWLLNVPGFFTVAHKPNILLGWVVSEGARYMETLSDERVLNQTCELLNKFVGKSYDIPEPNGFMRSQWYTNKHFRGTYSYRTMESERTDVWQSELAAPLLIDGKPIVMFAGEATSSHRFSTVDGAIETGLREADRLINLYKNTPKS